MRSVASQLGWILAHRSWPVGYCLKYVRSAFGLEGKYATANSAWSHAQHRHTQTAAPRGVPVFYSGGRYGHVAWSAGDGKVYSTDAPTRGRVGLVPINWFAANWNYHKLGWTEDLNGHRVWSPPTMPTVDASNVALHAVRSDASPHGILIKRALAAEVGKGFMNMSSNVLGWRFRAQYKKWQQHLGYSGTDANGVPGFTSLTRLGSRHKFKVVQ